jgi:hypothetical protein
MESVHVEESENAEQELRGLTTEALRLRYRTRGVKAGVKGERKTMGDMRV